VLLVVTVFVTLWVAEFALRLVFHGHLGYATGNEAEWHVLNDRRGWAHRPNAVFHMQAFNYEEVAHINSRGTRGPEFTPTPKPGVTRIMIVSDSGTFGSGVADDETVAAQLQHILGNDKFEVINLSVAAYSTVQEYRWLIDEGLSYKPDVVLLGFAAVNDIQTNYYPLQKWFQREAKRPYARLDAEGKLVIEDGYLKQSLARKRKGPGLAAEAYETLIGPMVRRVISLGKQAITGGRKNDPNVWLGWILLDDFAMDYAIKGRTHAQYEQMWRDGWAVTAALIKDMRDRSQAAGARFAMWSYVSKMQAEPETLKAVQKALPKAKIDIDKPERELKALGKRLDIPVFEMMPAMQAAVKKGDHKYYFGLDDEHMTRWGHRVTAETLAAQLRTLGLLPAP
jgi:lysophospholipase L1-like esterase